MKKLFTLLLTLFAFAACTELIPQTPDNGNEGGNGNGNTEQPADPENASFKIAVEELHAAYAVTQVVPENPEMYYVMYLEEVSYFQGADINTPEQLWADDFYAFEGKAIAANMNLKEYMLQANILFQGSQRIQWNNVLPGIKSVLYVYGVEFDEDGANFEAVTNVAWKLIVPERAPLRDINFAIDVECDGAEATITIEPENFDGYYLVKVVSKGDELYPENAGAFTDEYMATISDEWTYLYDYNIGNNNPKEEILKTVGYSGKQTLDLELVSDAEYSVLVFAVEEYDGFVQVVSKPSYHNFVTEQVQQSNMDIEIEITNCYVRVADLRITPSDSDAQYMMYITPTYYLPEDYTNETLLEYALGEFYYYTYTFKDEMTSHLNTLYPNTEYIVVAFGYSGGVVTTDVYTKIFKTEKEGVCELNVTDVVVTGPYRPSDLYNYDPEAFKYYTKPYYYDSIQYIITVEVKTDQPTDDIFYDFVPQMDYDYHGYDVIFYDLLISTCLPFEVGEGFWESGPYYMCAAAFDYKGNITPMWMSELYNWTESDIRPVEEFIEKWEANKNIQVMSVSAAR